MIHVLFKFAKNLYAGVGVQAGNYSSAIKSLIQRLSVLIRGQSAVDRLITAEAREVLRAEELRKILEAKKRLVAAKEVNAKLRKEIADAGRIGKPPAEPAPAARPVDKLRRH